MHLSEFKKDWPLPDEYMLELGRITSLYSVLENTVNISINKLSGFTGPFDPSCAIILAHLNFQQRIDILETLFEQLSKMHAEYKEYESVIKLAKRAQKGRNKYVHGALVYDKENKKVLLPSITARGKLNTNIEAVHKNDLVAVSVVIDEATCALLSLIFGEKLKPIWERAGA